MKKVKIILIALIIVSSATIGTVFATSDVGGGLKEWYDSRFKLATEGITKDEVQHAFNALEASSKINKNILIQEAQKKIKEEGLVTSNQSTDSISLIGQKYIDQVTEKQQKIINDIPNVLNQYVIQKKQEVDEIVDQLIIEGLKK